MRPAWSIILFTVFSGLGFGMAAMLTLVADTLAPLWLGATAATAAAAIIGGLAASTGHLANPKNAWRAFFRLRSSWLSREAALALLFFPLFFAWTLSALYRHGSAGGLAVAVLIVAALTVHCTAMIYAGLKPIRLWRHPLTPINYLLLATASGLLPLCAVVAAHEQKAPMSWLVVALGVFTAAAVGKWLHFRRADEEHNADGAAATGLQAANVRLLDTGHSAPNFLTREFLYHPSSPTVRRARRLTAAGVFAAPLLALLLTLQQPTWYILLWLCCPLMTAGLLAERWLFFAEARHVVRLYHHDKA